MTTSAQLGVARQAVQLQINQTKPEVDELEVSAASGRSWSDIENSWTKTSQKLFNQASTLDNLKKQNAGLNNDPGQSRLNTLITKNQVEVTTMQTTMNGVRTQAFKNTQITSVTQNITKNSSGEIIKTEQIGSVETSRFTTPVLGNDLVFTADTDIDQIIPNLESKNKPTNARRSILDNDELDQLGDLKGSGATSTVGGGATIKKIGQTQTSAVASATGGSVTPLSGNDLNTGTGPGGGGAGGKVEVAPGDDAFSVKRNNVGNAINADGVEGRTSVAEEFLKPIKASPNPLLGLASQTYSVSIYMMNRSEYVQFLGTDKKTLPTRQLILQSGGAKAEERNKYFDVDFYIENIEFETVLGSQGSGAPHNVTKLNFDILEPQGITFLERLKKAVTDHVQEPGVNINAQTYLMVIRFYGYDEFGNLVTKNELPSATGNEISELESTSDPEALVEKFIPFQFNDINYKINNKAVVYSCNCATPQNIVGYSTARGSIPFNFQLSASTVKKLLNGNSELVPLVPIVTTTTSSGLTGGPPNRNRVTSTTTEEVTTVEQQRAGKLGLQDRTVTSGLCDALNQHQRELAKKNGMIPDEYIIEIEDVPGLIDAKMNKQGRTNLTKTTMQKSSDANQQKNMEKVSLDKQTKEYSISAGTQIIQLIDQVLKNSTYVTAQQTIAFDEITNKEIRNPPVRTVQWYRITQLAAPKEYCKIRNDYAYQITYRISRYQINTPRSPYFPPAMYRGAHKIYNYWFTGLNTEVLDFDIEVKSNFVTIMGKDGLITDEDVAVGNDARFAEKRFFQSAPDSSTQGASGDAGRPAAQLASRLYSPADVSKADLTIVGDPDFIMQSELFYSAGNLEAFEPDGSVNGNAGEVLFEIRFNRPVDYNMATGETPVNSENSDSKITGEKNLAAESLVYAATNVTNKLADGKFTQSIQGVARMFDNAVNSPKQKQIEKNVVEEPGLDAFGGAGDSVRPSKNVIPPGARSGRQVQPTAGQDPRAGNFKTATVNGSKTNTQPYSSATVNNDVTNKIAKLPDSTVNYSDDADVTPGESDWQPRSGTVVQPPVQPKPGSNTVSDDAGTKTSPLQESLFAKKRRQARQRAENAKARGAKVVGSSGGGVNKSSLFK
jgi:hypothetical protein